MKISPPLPSIDESQNLQTKNSHSYFGLKNSGYKRVEGRRSSSIWVMANYWVKKNLPKNLHAFEVQSTFMTHVDDFALGTICPH